MAEVKTTVTDVIPMMTKITEHKLNGSNFLDWSKTIRIYLRSIEIDDHLTKNPPTDETCRIRNFIHSEVINLINYCEFVKELIDYLEFLHSDKRNIFRIYNVCMVFYRVEKNDRTLTFYFMDFKRVYEELNVLMPFSTDVKTQQVQREQIVVISFLAGLSPKFETAKSQILYDFEILSLHDVFTKVLRTEFPITSHPTSALVSRNDSGR
ncbi:hypothetical protein MANES_09G019650v8 [Manihot esculenta]|uniref:Uncharacterized protein n=1 Tax=Manihot esculenta TaxID=3983 RepID=A0ACB7H1X3_MANES|nr:hypothetical protein MANES_09G019650v8 [Manihot esculenta]